MCGILGAIESRSAVDPAVLTALNDSMIRRGPDGDGYFFSPCGRLGMAMRRLAIIDPAGGRQPLYSADRRIAAMQNGEIYNHRELRAELESRGYDFRTRSDTEVLVHGYEEWGLRGLLDRLDGMFAIAIADSHERTLHLARDRFGEKPLYYFAAPGRFAYASQLLTLAAYPGVDTSFDVEALYWYLALHFVPGECTMIRGIRKLRPGHFISVDWNSGWHRTERYWRLGETSDRPRDKEEIEELLERSVRSRLIADVPVGIFLSGGLDSSLIAAMAARESPKVATFSMGFPDESHDERPFAQEVADKLGTDHRHYEFDEAAFRDLLPLAIEAMDEPLGDPAVLPLCWLSEAAARDVKVVLCGEGADELFAGYSYYALGNDRGLRGCWRRRRSRSDLLQRDNTSPSGFPLLTTERERTAWLGLTQPPESASWHADLVRGWESIRDPLRRRCLADVETWLCEDLLMKLDKSAMAHGLEGRAPYLSPALAEAAFALPHAQKLHAGRNKTILRDISTEILPRGIAQRPKQGFVLPMRRWLSNALKGAVIEGLFPAANLGGDPSPFVRVLREEAACGIQRERLTYALIVLAKWAIHARDRIAGLRAAMRQTIRAAA
jgi:asparagine synthase (glutamine-hydrolysing)